MSSAIHTADTDLKQTMEAEEARQRAAQDERERKRYMKLANKFRYGGMVTVYEADDYLGLERGHTKAAYDRGEIKGRLTPYGNNKVTIKVEALDAKKLFGIPHTT